MESNEQQVPFCLQEISDSRLSLSGICEQLPKVKEQYDKYKGTKTQREVNTLGDLQKTVKKMWNEFPLLTQNLSELGSSELSVTAGKLYNAVKKFDYLGAVSYEPLIKALKVFCSQLPVADDKINMAALAHLANRAKMGYYPTDLSHVELLKSAFLFPNGNINAIDPCCGEGLALECFCKDENANTYGVEIDEVRGEEAQKHIDRVGYGSYFHSRISLNAFQVLFLNPPYLSVPSEHGNKRLEKSFLADSIRLLAEDGVMVYIIPYYRATNDVCRVLCENFTDLRVYKFEGSEFERFKQVAFLGRRVKRHEAIKEANGLTEYMLNIENIPPVKTITPNLYKIPESNKKIELFKGAKFNETELLEQLKKSTSHNVLFATSELDKRERYPLLPLNLSQIGLVGASGMMNGLIECDSPHVIKGRIVKERKSKLGQVNDHNKQELKEVITNKLVFNVLTESGMKSLG